jgi:hypothetical protein
MTISLSGGGRRLRAVLLAVSIDVRTNDEKP